MKYRVKYPEGAEVKDFIIEDGTYYLGVKRNELPLDTIINTNSKVIEFYEFKGSKNFILGVIIDTIELPSNNSITCQNCCICIEELDKIVPDPDLADT